MAYLFGDSTDSGLELNYIEFLKAALDFAVDVLLADHRIERLHQAGDDRRREAEAEIEDLRLLATALARTLDEAPGAAESITKACAATLRVSSQDAVKRATGQVRAQLAEDLATHASAIQGERQVASRALMALLQHHDLPGASQHLELALEAGATRYGARLRGRSDVGLEWLLTLAIRDGALSTPLKVERVAPHFELKVPESGGWMRKGVRMRTVKLGGHVVTEVTRAAGQTAFKLRATGADDDPGYNIQVSEGDNPVRVVRVARGGEASPPFEPGDEDVARVLELAATLRGELIALADRRIELIEARLDGKPLAEHEGPSVAVRRLITRMAPVVQEIIARSVTPDELVLKRVTADDRREEIFVSRADLLGRLERVPTALRPLFSPLGLGVGGAAAVPTAAAAARSGRLSAPPPAASPPARADVADHEEVTRPPPEAPREVADPPRTPEGLDASRDAYAMTGEVRTTPRQALPARHEPSTVVANHTPVPIELDIDAPTNVEAAASSRSAPPAPAGAADAAAAVPLGADTADLDERATLDLPPPPPTVPTPPTAAAPPAAASTAAAPPPLAPVAADDGRGLRVTTRELPRATEALRSSSPSGAPRVSASRPVVPPPPHTPAPQPAPAPVAGRPSPSRPPPLGEGDDDVTKVAAGPPRAPTAAPDVTARTTTTAPADLPVGQDSVDIALGQLEREES